MAIANKNRLQNNKNRVQNNKNRVQNGTSKNTSLKNKIAKFTGAATNNSNRPQPKLGTLTLHLGGLKVRKMTKKLQLSRVLTLALGSKQARFHDDVITSFRKLGLNLNSIFTTKRQRALILLLVLKLFAPQRFRLLLDPLAWMPYDSSHGLVPFEDLSQGKRSPVRVELDLDTKADTKAPAKRT